MYFQTESSSDVVVDNGWSERDPTFPTIKIICGDCPVHKCSACCRVLSVGCRQSLASLSVSYPHPSPVALGLSSQGCAYALFYLKCQLNFFFLFWQIPSSPCLKLTLCLLVLFRVTLSLLWILTARVFCFPINCLYSWFAFLLFACGEPSSALLVSHVNNVPNPGTTWYLDHALAWQSDLAECCFPLRLFIL